MMPLLQSCGPSTLEQPADTATNVRVVKRGARGAPSASTPRVHSGGWKNWWRSGVGRARDL